MDILVNVVNQKLKMSTNLKSIIDGTQQFVRFVFNLGSDWDELTSFAQFCQNGVAYNQYLDSDNCAYLPAEIGVGTCTMMLYGTNGATIGTTNYLTFTIDDNILIADARSTEISQSLYQQLVTRVDAILNWNEQATSALTAVDQDLQRQINTKANASDLEAEVSRARAAEQSISSALERKADQSAVDDLAIQLTELESSELVAGMIEDAVEAEMRTYLNAGVLSNMTIVAGSVTRDKVDAGFEATLAKADSAMQPSMYDPQNFQQDVFAYASAQAGTVQSNLDDVTDEISGAYTVTDTSVYTNLGDAVRGVYTLSKQYTDDSINNYDAFTIQIVDELPQQGEPYVFYLIPNDHGGYDKWWWITDTEAQESKFDKFGGASTEVVTALPASPSTEVDYILKTANGCLYYKWIDNNWQMIGGSRAEIYNTLPSTGNEYTDYYIKNSNDVYVHYRWIDDQFELVGSDSYTKAELDTMLQNMTSAITTMQSSVNTQAGRIDTIDAKVNQLGNLVSDVSAGTTGIVVSYKDGTTKNVATKDATVVVEDVTKNDSGLTITYSDGETEDIEISGGGGGGGDVSGSASITRITDSSTQCVYGQECPISYTFTATDSAGDAVGDGAATWYIGGVKKATSTAHQGNNTFDIGQYLSVGTNNVKVSISVDVGGDTPLVRTKTWTVNAVNMYVVWDYDDTTINEASTVAIRWTPYGDISKTTHIIIDGQEAETSTTTRSGVQQFVTINKLSHGSHMVEIYCTATVNNKTITSDSVYHDMIFVDSSNNTPIISCSVSQNTMTQYDTVQIPVVIYTPGKLTSDAVLKIGGETIAEWNDVDRTVHYWNYTPNDFGEKVLTITSGVTTKTINMTVTKLDIDNEEVTGYVFRMKSSDIAGNDALRAWNSNGITATFSENFDWNNGGIQTETDEAGNVRQYIGIKAGTTMTINYELFGNDAKVHGKNFKLIFKAQNARDYEATFLDCLSDGIGIRLGANGGIANSEQNSVSVQYKEDSYIEFEFDVYPDSGYRYIQTYIDGVLTSTNVYAANDNFTQTTKKKIVLGSRDCDVNVYMVKVYENYLTLNNHIENFIADAPNAQEMVARFNRNDILADNGEISYEKLAVKNPNCRVHLWNIPRMTDDKKDYVTGCSYQQIYEAGGVEDQITANNVTINIQGTSSVDYKASGANTDGNFTEGFTDGNGVHHDTYSMTADSIGVNYFNTKVNIASCENINNMCLAEWYGRFQPYKTAYKIKNPDSRDTMEHHIGVQFIRDQSGTLFNSQDPNGSNYHMYAICNMGNSKKNSAVFHDTENPLECCFETKDNNSNYCMMTQPITQAELDTEDFFEFRYPDDKTKRTQAMKDSFIAFVNWMASCNPAAHTDEALASPVTYGPYTFVGTGQEDEVLAGLTIEDYAGTYTHDTYEYRMAKLLDECEDHLIMDSIVYHYVFIEQHAMVDNVCKNTFWGTEDQVHWHLVKNYDNDTADGNNNTGKLTIPFGSEGMDTLGSGDVFNGKMSVYWQFVYGLYEARRRMWLNRENAGAWDANAYLAFATGQQNYLPERVYNQDYWYKYLRLYETDNVVRYIPMLEGGKKTHQREAFVMNNLWYMASQYMGTACTSRTITLRGYTPSTWSGVEPKSQVQVTLYNKGYVVVQVGSVFKRIKADKGQMYTVTFTDSGDMNDTVINIHGANNVQAIGDISCLYVGSSDFSAATRLRSLQIGSTETGYRNDNLTEIGFGTNRMLENLYIQNCPNITSTLDLSGCQALVNLDIRGSGFTGVIFAVGGLITDAKLCSPAALNMRNLYNLTDAKFSLESYNNLTTLRLEECPGIDSLNMVTNAVNLGRVRILGIDWELASTDTLNRLLAMIGLDESDHNTEHSVLTGQVYVSGQIRNHELNSYEAAWDNLIVLYEPSSLIEQYLATYKNLDGTTLYSTYVDRGATPPDPVQTGAIDEPTMAQDEKYTYTYSGWDDITSIMLTARTITATYLTTPRTYRVTWYSRAGAPLGTVLANYGDEVVYSGFKTVPYSLPTNTSEEGAYIYNLFKGWDKSTGFIKGDTNVYAIWDRASLPELGTKDLSEMSMAEIYGISQARLADSYFEDKDSFELKLGHDFDFTNVESEVLLENRFFDGMSYVDTDVKLFDADADSFTLFVDYEFVGTNTTGATLVSCYEEDGNEGFRLRYTGNPNVQWGDKTMIVGYNTYRNVLVMRHVKGSNILHIYVPNLYNGDSAQLEIAKDSITRSRDTLTDVTLTFGAVKFLIDGGHDYYGTGWVHKCKIWHDDLGDFVASQLASWETQTLHMEFTGANRYRLSGNTSQRANASFYASELLYRNRRMHNNSDINAGGYSGSEMRDFLNRRIYEALPYEVISALKQVRILASVQPGSTEVQYSDNYIYLPSMREVSSSSSYNSEPYASEGDHISFYSNYLSRTKFLSLRIPEDHTLYSISSDPTSIAGNIVKEGDIWNNGGYYYYYLPASKVATHSRIATRLVTSSDNREASDGGVWLRPESWWSRSSYYSTGSSSAMYHYFSYSGGTGGVGPTSSYGVLIGFSI